MKKSTKRYVEKYRDIVAKSGDDTPDEFGLSNYNKQSNFKL